MEFGPYALETLFVLVLLAVLYLLVVALLPGVPTPRQELKPASTSPPGLPPDESPTRVETFRRAATWCRPGSSCPRISRDRLLAWSWPTAWAG
jgi:hypothetical protein